MAHPRALGRWPANPSENVERQGWRDRALQGRIYGRFSEGLAGQRLTSKRAYLRLKYNTNRSPTICKTWTKITSSATVMTMTSVWNRW